ncbi:MAG TPA: stage V sporulation protein AE [Firmicutes bacterium]|jgi:stage V sporulation protein AE|nr:stage V sporulation protein AE [Bacillota bacterium]
MNGQIYFNAFWVGGLICLLTQLVWDYTKLNMGHILASLTVLGGILGGLGLYDKLIDFAGGGATMPILSFGNALVKGAITEAEKNGVIGVLMGMFELTSTGITAAIIFGFLVALIFKPKG